MPTLQQAIDLTRLGLSIIPIEPRGKRPLVRWQDYQQRRLTEAELTAHCRRRPDANIGIITGRISDVFVLDVDGDAGATTLAALTARNGPLPPTWRVSTGKGAHWYFWMPAGRACRNTAGRLGPGLDTRGEGGYVVAPPSIHPSGRLYQWAPGRSTRETELADAPTWLLDLLDRPKPAAPQAAAELPAGIGPEHPYIRRAVEGELNRILDATEGTRNHALNRAAFALGQLVGAGALDAAYVRRRLYGYGLRIGLTEQECIATIDSGIAAGMKQPRGRGAA